MILCDVNVWLALALSDHTHHRTATAWLDGVDQPASILFCRATQQGLLRLLTNEAVLRPYGNPPLSNNEAWAVYRAFLDDERVILRVDEPPRLEPLWRQLATTDKPSPKLWMDAYLAAFASTSGSQLVTTDGGFRQFPRVDVLVLG